MIDAIHSSLLCKIEGWGHCLLAMRVYCNKTVVGWGRRGVGEHSLARGRACVNGGREGVCVATRGLLVSSCIICHSLQESLERRPCSKRPSSEHFPGHCVSVQCAKSILLKVALVPWQGVLGTMTRIDSGVYVCVPTQSTLF